MPWETLTSNDGIYLVNWDGITRILRSCIHARLTDAHSELQLAEKHYFGPDLYSVAVDWNKINLETTTQTESELRRFYAGAKRSMQSEINRIVGMMEDAEGYRDNFEDKQLDAQNQTMDNINRSVHRGEIGAEVAKGVRDTSAGLVMILATPIVLEAGFIAGASSIGVGSLMKGSFVYQDTGKARNAVATFSTNLVLGVADLGVGGAIDGVAGKAAKVGLKILWAKGQAVLEVPKGLIEGKTLKEAMAAGAVKLGTATFKTLGKDALEELLKEKGMEGLAIPVDAIIDIVEDKATEALLEDGEKKPKETKGPPAHLHPPHRNHRALDAVIFDQKVIQQSAIRKIGSGALL